MANFIPNKFKDFSDEFILAEAYKVAEDLNLPLVEVEDTDKVRVYTFSDGSSYMYFTLINNTNEVEVVYNNEMLFKGEIVADVQ